MINEHWQLLIVALLVQCAATLIGRSHETAGENVVYRPTAAYIRCLLVFDANFRTRQPVQDQILYDIVSPVRRPIYRAMR